MLVLSRKVEESLIIDGTIIVTILAVEGDRVKLGILAPPEVTILRKEVRDRAANRPAAPPTPRPAGRRSRPRDKHAEQ